MTANNVTTVIANVLSSAGLASLAPVRDNGGERDRAAMPFTVVKEGISTSRSSASGRGVERRTELVQLDLFQNWADSPDDPTLMPAIWAALAAAEPATMQGHGVLRVMPQGTVRRPDPVSKVVTESMTIRITHTP